MAEKRKAGRPKHNESDEANRAMYVYQLCKAISQSDKGMKRICDAFKENDPNFPPMRTIRDWILENPIYSAQYETARAMQAEYLVEQILEIADDSSEDEIFVGADDESGASGKRVQNSEFIQRSRLRVDARKWIASKILPKKYGEKVEQEVKHSGSIEGPVLNLVLNGAKNGP